jgi:hypothetical protein
MRALVAVIRQGADVGSALRIYNAEAAAR